MIFISETEWNFRGKCINHSKIRAGLFFLFKKGILVHSFRLPGIMHGYNGISFLGG